MKSLNKYIVVFSLLGLATLVSCEKDFDKINDNPNAPTQAAPPALLAQAIRAYGYNDFDVWYGGRSAMVACQHWSQRNYTSEDRYAFRSGTNDGLFRNNYIWMNDLQDIIRYNTDEATKGQMAVLYGDNRMQVACAEIVKAWVFQLLTDTYGDIPYSQALDFKTYPQPAYDTQKQVYDGLIATLKKVHTDLKAVIADGGSGYEQGDLFYGGNLNQWDRLANSIRLRLALRASNVDAAYLVEAQSAIADGVMQSNADNAQCKFSSVGAPNEAPKYNGFFDAKRNDFSITRQFAELLKGRNDANISFTNPFFGLVDPRWKVFSGPRYSGDLTRNGVPYGMTDAQTKAYVGTAANKVVSYYLASNPPIFLKANFPSTFMDYPTVCFMVSEVNNWDATWFQKGVEASLEFWGATPGTYVADVMALFNAADAAHKKEMVLTQKYIHLFQQPYEAWAEYRRTGYPKSLVKPGQTTVVLASGAVTFAPVTGYESGSDIVARFMYPSSEFTLNKDNVEAAVAKLGENTHAYRVWWDGGGHQ